MRIARQFSEVPVKGYFRAFGPDADEMLWVKVGAQLARAYGTDVLRHFYSDEDVTFVPTMGLTNGALYSHVAA